MGVVQAINWQTANSPPVNRLLHLLVLNALSLISRSVSKVMWDAYSKVYVSCEELLS